MVAPTQYQFCPTPWAIMTVRSREAFSIFRRLFWNMDLSPLNLSEHSSSPNLLSQLLSAAPAELRNIDLAMKSARRSIELQPEDKECWNALSWSLFRTEQWQECLDSLAKGDEEGGQSIRIMALWQLGRHDEARVLFDGEQKRLQEFKAKVKERLTRNVATFPSPETFTRLYKEAAAMLQVATDDSAPPPASTAAM